MKSSEIRQSFLDFFASKQHRIVKSAPVVPQDDPTLLFTNAGMNQFKDIFLGTAKPQSPRAADTQKCIRVSGKHNDLEEVGRDTYHHTFFEMLGNWSFGDYFKQEAIEWAWELLTDVWKLPKDKLYATIFEGDEKDGVPRDDEAAEMWKTHTDIDPDHILAFGKKDNFWEMGETGPCGPCSEIHIDRGPEFCDCGNPDTCAVNADCARYIELWNLVFIQFNRADDGVLSPLPAKHVDTGAGFERLVAVMQQKFSNYDTDVFMPIIQAIADVTGKPYDDTQEQGVSFRVIADHVRTLSFAITDGAIPGNEGRGYVLRRILRRAARFGRLLDMREPFIYKIVNTVAAEMGEAFPEIAQRKDYVANVIKSEEESFGRTLDRGIEIFENKAAELIKSGNTVFPGDDAFLLHDTFGFPLDLTQLMAEEKGLTVDVAVFNENMQEQRQRSNKARDAKYATIEIAADIAATEFVGYEVDSVDAQVVQFADDRLVLDKTPFYAESGGQVGDTGKIYNNDFEFIVNNTKRIGEHIVHFGELTTGSAPTAGNTVTAAIASEQRRETERNHTVTHLAHKALKMVLGEHVNQAGSLVGPDYMRFDFTHFERVKPKELQQIESLVNKKIVENLDTTWNVMALEQAKAEGATALFGEKYGDTVRVVEVDGYSKELCGGSHVRATGEIGVFVITSESAVASGIRRIECLTGLKAHEYLRSREAVVNQAAQLLSCPPNELTAKITTMLDERKELEKELKKLKKAGSKDVVGDLLKKVDTVAGVHYIAEQIEVNSVDDLRNACDLLRNGLKSGVGVLGAAINDKVSIACIVTQDLVKEKGLKAGDIVKKVASYANGGGGGAPHMAMAGAKDVSKLPLALSKVNEIVSELLG